MATKKAADHTLYHLSPKGFWKRFRDTVVVNPEISSGLPLPDKNRFPPPASRPEKYSTPATKASDPAQNPYWRRDARRHYPRLSVVTQSLQAQLLLASPELQPISAPGSEADKNKTSVPTSAAATPDLTTAISDLLAARKAFSPSKLPPRPPTLSRWVPERTEDAPHDPDMYFPMQLMK